MQRERTTQREGIRPGRRPERPQSGMLAADGERQVLDVLAQQDARQRPVPGRDCRGDRAVRVLATLIPRFSDIFDAQRLLGAEHRCFVSDVV